MTKTEQIKTLREALAFYKADGLDNAQWIERMDGDQGVMAMKALAATAQDGDDWQPIETAPRDRSEILCGCYPWGDPWNMAVCWWDSEKGIWVYCDEDSDGHPTEFGHPTHWMPLPEPPKGEQK